METKKLCLNKETLRNLQGQEMVEIGGGITPTFIISAVVVSAGGSIALTIFKCETASCPPPPTPSCAVCATNITPQGNPPTCSCQGCRISQNPAKKCDIVGISQAAI